MQQHSESQEQAGRGTPSTNGRDALGRDQASRTHHIAGLDIIRLCAALMVVFYNFAYWDWHDCACVDAGFPELVPYSWWGWVGVPVFFVISGFVIVLSAEGRTAADFFKGRFLRLAPGLWFFATSAFLVLLFTGAETSPWATLLLAKSVLLWPVGPWIDGVYWSQDSVGISPLVPGIVFAFSVLAIITSLAATRVATPRSSGRFFHVIRVLGLASYALYLVHFITGRWIFMSMLAHGVTKNFSVALSMALCLGLSILFVLTFEAKLRSWIAAAYEKLFTLAGAMLIAFGRDDDRSQFGEAR